MSSIKIQGPDGSLSIYDLSAYMATTSEAGKQISSVVGTQQARRSVAHSHDDAPSTSRNHTTSLSFSLFVRLVFSRVWNENIRQGRNGEERMRRRAVRRVVVS